MHHEDMLWVPFQFSMSKDTEAIWKLTDYYACGKSYMDIVMILQLGLRIGGGTVFRAYLPGTGACRPRMRRRESSRANYDPTCGYGKRPSSDLPRHPAARCEAPLV